MKIFTESKIKRIFTGSLIALLAIVVVLSAHGMPAYAEGDIPESGVAYTLTYPDGTKVTENAKGEPLSYSDVQDLLKPANWKKMAEGLISDANGKVELNAAWNKGTIRIVETKVPAGYTQGTESEKTAELKDGFAVFVNPKEKDPKPEPASTYEITYDLNGGEYNGSTEDIVEYYKDGETISIHEAPEREGYEFDYWKGSEYQPGDSYTVTADHTFTAQWIKDTNATTTSSGSPKTGDGNTVALYIIIGGVSAAIFTLFLFKRRKVRAGIISMMLIGVFAIGTVYAADGFVINKIDDNGDPVEGAVFDIYGKPEVTWEQNISVTLTKTWNDDDNRDAIRPAAGAYAQYLTLKADGTAVDKAPTVKDNNDNTYTVTWSNLNKHKGDSEIAYTVEESAITGYTAGTVEGSASAGFTLTNTHTPETITISGTKTWTSSTGNNDDLDTSKIPAKYTVRLEKSTDGTNWRTVTSQEVASYMAPLPAPTDPILPTDKWTFDNQPKYENGVELQYRCVEDPVPDGFTMSGGTKADNYNLTNTYNPSGIRLNVNFNQSNSDLSWVAKTVPVTKGEPAVRKINVGGEEKEVYMYTYGDPDKKTYYGDMPNSYSVSQWYDANGNELNSTDLINALKDNAELVNEQVTRDVFGGLFQDNITKTITVSGPNGFSKSYTITLGENSTYQIPITDAGEYTITQELVTSEDINQAEFPDPGRNTGYTGIFSIETAVVNVTKDGDKFSCEMDKGKTMVFEHVINSSSKPYKLNPCDGENPYAESYDWHQGGGTSAAGDTVTINNYMDGVAVK